MAAMAITDVGRQVIHILRYPETRLEYNFGVETLVHEMPEFILATDEAMRPPGLHGKPIALGTVEFPANAYVAQTSVDLYRPAGFSGSLPGAVDFLDTYLNHMFQVGASSVLGLAADPYHSELLGLKLLADHRESAEKQAVQG
jgi:hypothetical protein